jgi:hypothetical protein
MKLAGDYLAQSHKQSAELKLHPQPDPSASETSRGNAASLGALRHVPLPPCGVCMRVSAEPRPLKRGFAFFELSQPNHPLTRCVFITGSGITQGVGD